MIYNYSVSKNFGEQEQMRTSIPMLLKPLPYKHITDKVMFPSKVVDIWCFTLCVLSIVSTDLTLLRIHTQVKNTNKLVSFSNVDIPNITHSVQISRTCHLQSTAVVAVSSVLHCMLSNLCSLTETEPDILLHTWKYWQRSCHSTQELKHSLKQLAPATVA